MGIFNWTYSIKSFKYITVYNNYNKLSFKNRRMPRARINSSTPRLRTICPTASVFEEINFARTNPSGYAQTLMPMMKAFNKLIRRRNDGTLIRTKEGMEAVRECIDFLLCKEPVPVLRSCPEALCRAAMDHVETQGPSGRAGHTGPDGSTMGSRIARHCHAEWTGECIDYGSKDAREIVHALLIDDGVPSRGHRHIIFKSNCKHVGIANGPHKRYGCMTVLDFAGVIGPKKKTVGKAHQVLTLLNKMSAEANKLLGLLPSGGKRVVKMVQDGVKDPNKTVLIDYTPQSKTNGHKMCVWVKGSSKSRRMNFSWGCPLRK